MHINVILKLCFPSTGKINISLVCQILERGNEFLNKRFIGDLNINIHVYHDYFKYFKSKQEKCCPKYFIGNAENNFIA